MDMTIYMGIIFMDGNVTEEEKLKISASGFFSMVNRECVKLTSDCKTILFNLTLTCKYNTAIEERSFGDWYEELNRKVLGIPALRVWKVSRNCENHQNGCISSLVLYNEFLNKDWEISE